MQIILRARYSWNKGELTLECNSLSITLSLLTDGKLDYRTQNCAVCHDAYNCCCLTEEKNVIWNNQNSYFSGNKKAFYPSLWRACQNLASFQWLKDPMVQPMDRECIVLSMAFCRRLTLPPAMNSEVTKTSFTA